MQRLSLPPRQDSVGILLQTTRGLLVAFDFDHMNKMIYFTDVARKAIWCVGFNGTGMKEIISEGLSSPEGINQKWFNTFYKSVQTSHFNEIT